MELAPAETVLIPIFPLVKLTCWIKLTSITHSTNWLNPTHSTNVWETDIPCAWVVAGAAEPGVQGYRLCTLFHGQFVPAPGRPVRINMRKYRCLWTHVGHFNSDSHCSLNKLLTNPVCWPGPATGGWAAQSDLTVGWTVAGCVATATHACAA